MIKKLIQPSSSLSFFLCATLFGCDSTSQESEPAPGLPELPTERFCLAGLDFTGPDLEMPSQLSDTGCFEGEELRLPSADMVHYDVRSPLWTDGTEKDRWIVVPPGTPIEYRRDGEWQMPVGGVIVKNFLVRFPGADDATPVETRIMVNTENGWAFYSYAWDLLAREANLLEHGGVRWVATGDPVTFYRYQFPDQLGCSTCHSKAPGRVLGLRTEQLNRETTFNGGLIANQLEAFSSMGVIDREFVFSDESPNDEPALPDPFDDSLDLESRARSYLATHCGACHQPGGWTATDINMDLRFEIPLDETELCDVRSLYAYPVNTGLHRIKPGQPSESNIVGRMGVEGVGEVGQMPPLGRSTVDAIGLQLITDWIASLEDCNDHRPVPATP